MTAQRELLKWTWPSFGMVLPIDFLMAIAVLGIMIALAVMAYGPLLPRAKLTEALLAAQNVRLDLVERLAVSGEPIEGSADPVAGPARPNRMKKKHLSGEAAAEESQPDADQSQPATDVPIVNAGQFALTGQSADEENLRLRDQTDAWRQKQLARESADRSSRYVRSARIVDNAIVVTGTVEELLAGSDYKIVLSPAVADADVPSVYIWNCGRRHLPEGWIARMPPTRGDLPDNVLPADCRRGSSR